MRVILSVSCLLCIFSLDVTAIPIALKPEKIQSVSNPKVDQADLAYKRGIEALASDRLDAAEVEFKEAYNFYPTVYALLGQAEIAFKRKDMDKARDLIEKALKEAPNDAHVQDSQARLLFIDQKFAESEAALKKALEIDPTLVRTYIALGDLYMTVYKKPEQAISPYSNALVQDPSNTGARFALGVALRQTGKYKEAESELKKVISQEKENPLPTNELARLYADQKMYDQALELWAGLLKQFPEYIDAYNGRATAYLAKNDTQAAIREFSGILKFAPDHADAYMNLGMVYQGMASWQEAETSYLQALKIQPRLALAYNNLAWMSADRGEKLNEALAWAKKAVELVPTSIDFLDTLGWVYRARKEYDLAIETYSSLTSKVESPTLFYHLGVTRMEKGDSVGAAEALNKALKLDSKFPYAEKATQLLGQLQ
jgi:tetratricopeptide (TPR) repeat protein